MRWWQGWDAAMMRMSLWKGYCAQLGCRHDKISSMQVRTG